MGKILKFGCLGVVGLIVIIIIIAVATGGGTKDSTSSSAPTAKTESSAKADSAKESKPAAQAGQPKPTATPEPSYKTGDKIAAGNWEYTVTKVEKLKTLTWSEFGNKTDAKGEWLIAYLILKNVGKENFGIATWDFDLYAGEVKYTASSEFGFYSWLKMKNLSNLGPGEKYPPGVEVKTAMLFDIAPDAKGLKLRLNQAKKDIQLE